MERMFDIKGFANAWNTHSADRLLEFYAEDAEVLAPPNPQPYRGREGVRQIIRETFDGLPDVNGDVEWSIQQGDKVAAIIHVSGKHTGPLVLGPGQTLEPSGKSVKFTLGEFIELDRNGKIRRETQLADVASLLMQVGVLGETASGKEPTKSTRQASR